MAGKSTRRARDQNWTVNFPPLYRKGKGQSQFTIQAQASSRTHKGRQVTVSEGHKRINGAYRSGGPFFTVSIRPSIQTRHYYVNRDRGDGVWLSYSGPCHVPTGVPSTKGNYSGFTLPSEDSSYLDEYGATAIALVDPTNASADVGTAIGEIVMDGITVPGIATWKNRTSVAKAAGSEYLSAVFGWLPLVKSITDTKDVLKQRNVILRGYRENAGKNVRREFAFDDEISEDEDVIYPYASANVAGGQVNMGDPNRLGVPVTRHRKTTVSRWFSGAFTYTIPDSDDRVGKMVEIDSKFDKLFGLSLTPDVIWELTQWSWAADWFSNAGDVIHNFTSFELGGLVMRYGFIMEETTIIDTYSMPTVSLIGDNGAVPPSTVTYKVKRRREANPFGFGLGWEDLSPSQLLITAALGITRLR